MDCEDVKFGMPSVESTVVQARKYNDASFFDALDELIFIADQNSFEMLFCNKAGRRILGVEQSEWLGKPCYQVLRRRAMPCMHCPARTGSADHRYSWITHNEHLNCNFKVSNSPIVYRGHASRVELCVDITENIKYQSRLQESLRTEAVLNEIIQLMYSESDLGKAMRTMLAKLGGITNSESAMLFEIQEKHAVNIYEWTRRGMAVSKEGERRLPLRNITRWLSDFERHEAVAVPDIELLHRSYPWEYRYLYRQNVKTLLCTPVTIGENLYGFLALINAPEPEKESVSSMLMTLSYFIGITQEKYASQKQLEAASYGDQMTGVENRNAFIRDMERYQRAVDAGTGRSIGVIYFDLNGLKLVNDQQGHRAGDRLILLLSDMLKHFFRRDEIYRTGGDEFVVLCWGIGEEVFESRVRRIREHMSTRMEFTVSIGQCWSDSLYLRITQVVSLADESMYREKQRYHNQMLGEPEPDILQLGTENGKPE